MNRKDVKKALNIDPKIEWQECNLEINLNYTRIPNIYQYY